MTCVYYNFQNTTIQYAMDTQVTPAKFHVLINAQTLKTSMLYGPYQLYNISNDVHRSSKLLAILARKVQFLQSEHYKHNDGTKT